MTRMVTEFVIEDPLDRVERLGLIVENDDVLAATKTAIRIWLDRPPAPVPIPLVLPRDCLCLAPMEDVHEERPRAFEPSLKFAQHLGGLEMCPQLSWDPEVKHKADRTRPALDKARLAYPRRAVPVEWVTH